MGQETATPMPKSSSLCTKGLRLYWEYSSLIEVIVKGSRSTAANATVEIIDSDHNCEDAH